jgi:hypothetical protein
MKRGFAIVACNRGAWTWSMVACGNREFFAVSARVAFPAGRQHAQKLRKKTRSPQATMLIGQVARLIATCESLDAWISSI